MVWGMELIDLYRRSVETWTSRVRTVPPDTWEAPTPCSDWTVRDLVSHVAGEDDWTVPLMNGSTIEEVGTSLDGDRLGDDPAGAAMRSADEAVAAVASTLPTGGKVHLSYGDEDMEEYIRQLVADHVVHAWDLAAGTGGERSLDDDLVLEVATWFAEREEMYRSGGAIGPRVDATGDAQTDLLAAFGRDPGWTAPQA